MYGEVGSLAGAIGGGLLGAVGDTLSAPRRGLWSLLGLPEDGNQLLADTFGMDKDALLTRALGVGAEMALDPLTYAGMLAGGPLAKLFGRASGAAKALDPSIDALAAARRAAQSGLVDRAAAEGETLAAQMARVPGFAGQDVAGIAGGQTRNAKLAREAAFNELYDAGLAVPGSGPPSAMGKAAPAFAPPNLPPDVLADVDVLGRTWPPGFGTTPVRGTDSGRMVGSALSRTGPDALPRISGDELDIMKQLAAAQPGGWEALDSAAAGGLGPRGLVEETMRQSAARMNAARPMPTLRSSMNNLTGAWDDALGATLDLPLPQAFDATQAQLAPLLQQRQALQDSLRFGSSDAASLAGGLGLGGYSGGMMLDHLRGGPTRRG